MAILWSLLLPKFLRDILRQKYTQSFRSQGNIQRWKCCKSLCLHSINQKSVTSSPFPAQGGWEIIWLFAQKEVKIGMMNNQANQKTCCLCRVRQLILNMWDLLEDICSQLYMQVYENINFRVFFFKQNLHTLFLSKI